MSSYNRDFDAEPEPPKSRPTSFFGRIHAPRPPSRGRPTRQPDPGMMVPSSGRKAPSTPYNEREDLRYSEAMDEEAMNEKSGIMGKIAGVGKGGIRTVKKHIEHKHGLERALLCAIAVMLLWGTSLVVCKNIVEAFVIRPATSLVRAHVAEAFNDTLLAKDQHEKCAFDARKRCVETYETSLTVEIDRIQLVEADNFILLRDLNVSRTLCAERNSEGIARLKTIKDSFASNQAFFNAYLKVGAPGTCSNVISIIDGNAAAVNSYNTADQYSQKEASRSKQLGARAVYDLDYFGGKFVELTGTQNAIDGTNTALNGTVGELGGIAGGFKECLGVDGQSPDFDTKCSGTVEGTLYTASEEARKEIARAHAQATEQLQGVIDAGTAVKTWYNDHKAAIEALGFSKPDFGFTSNPVNLPFSVQSQLDKVKTKVDDVRNNVDQRVDEMLSKINTDAGLLGAVKKIEEKKKELEETFSDYNPPTLPDDIDPADIEAERQEFMVDMSKSLENIDDVEVADLRSGIANSNSSSLEQVATRVDTLAVREWDFFVYPDIFAEEFFDTWDRIVQTSLSFDYVYRVLKSIMLIRKYWNISAISTPPSDVRVKSSVGDTTSKTKRNPAAQMAYLVTHPAFMTTVSIVFLAILTASFLSLYLPFFVKYSESCVDGNPDNQVSEAGVNVENGTFLVENSYTIAFQYAVTDGDKVGAVQLDKVNQEREVACNFQRENSTRVYQADVAFFSQIANLNTADRSAYKQIVECLDLVTLEAAETGGSPDFSHPTTGFFGASSECATGPVIPDKLPSSVFQCGAISTCKEEFGCTGPDVGSLYRTVFTAACSTEWLIHSSLLGFIMSSLTFVLLNLSRILFMRGFIRIYWRHLTGDKFAYIATCYENGDLEYPEKVTDEGYSFKALIRDNLATQLRSFTHFGYYMLMLAFTINLPWIGALLALGTSLQFTPSA